MVYHYVPLGVSLAAFIYVVLSFVYHLANLLPVSAEVLVIVRIALICKMSYNVQLWTDCRHGVIGHYWKLFSQSQGKYCTRPTVERNDVA